MVTVEMICGYFIGCMIFIMIYYAIEYQYAMPAVVSCRTDMVYLERLGRLFNRLCVITGDDEYKFMCKMISAIIRGEYPHTGVSQPLETWELLCDMNKLMNNGVIAAVVNNNIAMMCGDDIVFCLEKICDIVGEVRSFALEPMKYHVYLMCKLKILIVEWRINAVTV